MIESGVELLVQVQQVAAITEPVAIQQYGEQNQSIVKSLSWGNWTLSQQLAVIATLFAIAWCILGFVKLRAAADDPQLGAAARKQIVYGIILIGICALAFFFISVTGGPS